jgi:probable phosphoglycerate mutase
LKPLSFDALIASDLGRTLETAAFIAETTGKKVQTSPLLRERHYGVLEGLTVPEIKRQHPRVLQRLKSDDPDYEIPSGESHRRHYLRNVSFFETFLEENPGKAAVLVAHGGVLDSLFRYAAALPLSRPRCFITRNASIGIVRHGVFYGTCRWVIDSWGDVGHLIGIDSYQGLG